MPTQSDLYRQLLLLRRFDEKVLDEFSSGVFHGTTHTYLGQEANAVGIISNLDEGDLIFSNHRCHGHFLAYGGTPHSLFAELMGRSTGVCAGRGGSQHIHYKNFYSSGVQGSLVPTAVGAALAEKLKGETQIAVNFIGDGTLGQGVLYESLNMASLWEAPVLFVVENNHIAQTTPTDLSIAGSIPARFESFDIKTIELSTSDVEIISSTSKNQITQIRHSKKPQALILNTHRFGPHSKGDDTRSQEQVDTLKNEHDPLKILADRLSQESSRSSSTEAEDEINSAYQQAFLDPTAETL